jgi:predicted transposase YdaD
VEITPGDWLRLTGHKPAATRVIDADIGTIRGAADKIIHVEDTPEYLLHLDFQAGHDSARLPRRMRLYNDVMDDRHDMLVASVAVILHPGADSPTLTGLWQRQFPGELAYSMFRYQVLRIWKLPVEMMLDGGVGTLPLAPLANVPQKELPSVIERIKGRLQRPREKRWAADIWAATYVLLGLRYSESVAQILLQGVLSMKESVTYQAILREGRGEGKAEGLLEEAKSLLLRLGQKKLGKADTSSKASIEALTDIQQVELLAERLFEVTAWPELLSLAGPSRARKKGKR